MAGLTRGELSRKLVHVAVGGLAFAVRPLGFFGAVACAVAAILHNAFLLPRYGGRKLWREGESARGYALGIVLYPVTVLLLVLLYAARLEIAAAIWGILAFGDGMAAIVGQSVGQGNPLPWNPRKSWAGTLAYAICGGAGAYVLLQWTSGGSYATGFALAVSFATAIVGALLESQPQGLDDNFGVGRAGAIVGTLLGTTIWAFAGWRAFVLLFAFFVLGTLATKLGYERKRAAGIAQEREGRRGPGNALSKTSVPALAAILIATTPYPQVFALALAGAFATAAFDTVSSEVGKAYGRRTFLITTLRPVRRGSDGAVSLEGTLAGIGAALVIGGLGAATGLYAGIGVAAVTLAALVATTLESLVGATLERRGLLDNDAVNLLNSLAGALLAALLAVTLL